MGSAKTWAVAVGLAGALIAGGVALRTWVFTDTAPGSANSGGPVPVEVATIERGEIERRREFTGTLEASAQFVVAPKASGRIERIEVDLGDAVTRGQVVAILDDEELVQAEAEARAELAVARAEASAATKLADLARRNFDRVEGLRGRDIASEQDFDTARFDKAAAEAEAEVAQARVARAKAAHKAAQIRRAYTEVRADWSAGDEQRVVAARFADEGELLAANAALLSIVDLDPITVVVFVTEADYAELAPAMAVELRTDAFPAEVFAGEISRIAPVFREQTRQARVEMSVQNADGRLKPGMFVRARAVLDRQAEAVIVPASAIVERDGQRVVFVVDEAGAAVTMRAVEVGIREGDRVAVVAQDGAALRGQVVSLGQQQLVDGAEIVIPERQANKGEASS